MAIIFVYFTEKTFIGVTEMFHVFRLKKRIAAAAGALLAAAVVFCTGAAPTPEEQRAAKAVTVIMYHGLVKDSSKQNRYMINPSRFEEDLEYLTGSGCHTIFISELIDSVENGTPLPDKPVILTFDDGYLNNYRYAFPLLKKYDCKAVISPIAGAVEKAESEEYRSGDYSQCRWEELREMCDSGLVELENHTYDLHSINGSIQGAERLWGESDAEYEKRLHDDLLKANEMIREKTGRAPSALTLPFGAGGSDAVRVARKLGFRAVLDCEEKTGSFGSTDDLFHIHRYLRPNDMSSEEFFRHKGVL